MIIFESWLINPLHHSFFFFFNNPPPPEISPLPLHAALPICRPRFIGRHVLPASSVRKTPAAEMAMKIRPGWLGSRRIVCRHNPPAPGCQEDAEPWPRSPGRSEEHTSELQSLAYLVCRLLLEK